MRYDFLHLDVFAERIFEGNQLAVFPNAAGLDAGQMQRIAAEMAFSESTFVFKPESTGTDVRVRIFTPARELPMAGHPTIGTAFALAAENVVNAGAKGFTMGLGVGPTQIFLEWNVNQLDCAWMGQEVPTFGPVVETSLSLLAKALGVGEDHIINTGLPVQEVSSGVPFLFVPMHTRSSVNMVTVTRDVLREFFDANRIPELPVYVFSTEPGEDDAVVFSRMFAPVFGIPEDPATGGACGPLAAYLFRHGAITASQAKQIVNLQGVAMGRPSRILISLDSRDQEITDVRVGGSALIVGRGFIEVSAPE